MLALGVARLRQAPALRGVEEPGRRQRLAVEGARGALGHDPEGQEADVVALWLGRLAARPRAAPPTSIAAGGGGDAGCAKTEEIRPESSGPCAYAYPTVMPSSQTVTRLATVPRVARRRPPRDGARRRDRARSPAAAARRQPPTKPPDPAKSQVALLQAPKRPGEILVRGDLSPASHGPYAFDGRYVVRFQQFAPEDPNARLHRPDGLRGDAWTATPRSKARAACRSSTPPAAPGRTTLALHGKLFVDVSFGDFPYAMRFTPLK